MYKWTAHSPLNNKEAFQLLLTFYLFIAFDEGERLLFESRGRSSGQRAGCHAISCFERHLGQAGTFCLDLMCSVFSARELVSIFSYLFAYETLASLCLLQVCLSFFSQFSIKFSFLQEKLHSKIIRYVDVMFEMCSARHICFYRIQQDQLRSPYLILLQLQYIFSLLKAIYRVLFAFICHYF